MTLTKAMVYACLALSLAMPHLSAETEEAVVQINHTSEFNLRQLQQTLASNRLVEGQFTQERNLSMFTAPLQSSGQFILSRDQGLWWQQTQPFEITLVLTQDKLSQQFGSESSQQMNPEDNPLVFYFSHLFLSLFQGNTDKLQQQFNINLAGDQANWELILVPKHPPLTRVFKSIKLSGEDVLSQLTLTELRGDTTTIHFSDQSHPASLTLEQQRAFIF